MSSTVRESWCIDCASVQWFEAPPCEDGHGLDCLDLACVECGSAIVTGLTWSEPMHEIIVLVAA